MLAAERKIDKPVFGWSAHCYYLVDVAFSASNPIHRAILYTGFLDNGEPAGYANFWGSYEFPIPYSQKKIYYLAVVRQLTFAGET